MPGKGCQSQTTCRLVWNTLVGLAGCVSHQVHEPDGDLCPKVSMLAQSPVKVREGLMQLRLGDGAS
ncbi:uncharacterized protein THITE_2113843 [Thermothielavioides terrestris NRRL 8126]|uniref:Uncharacterized protein n=1 Tax=Thermothielavioides terrestris (strain ATCC 38088 / NRRL 8126) TaxID=578455 RepID=G2R4A6_THETT|nr:uncharacterized protein THITE_2113843 [Thermothielavioides terrestris NRRL 8126]AEO66053.1 hypothetical protein THITE_2113843 [Thermothielavioides terrestris NRRL 8126]